MMNFPDEPDEGAPGGGMMRWLITYADLITLLLAFFIVLYALNRTEQVKFALVARALARHFDAQTIVGQSPGPSIITGQSGTYTVAEARTLNQLQNRLQQAINQAGLEKQVTVSSTMRGVEITMNTTLLFRPASAQLAPAAVALVQRVGQVLTTVPNDVEVAGYTDSTPIRTLQYPSNWQLSAMRAANVVYVLSGVAGMQPDRLSVAGFGRYHAIASNATAAGRQANRRVNILVLRSSVAAVAIGHGP